MLIALLVMLGVELVVIVAFVAFVVSRKRWVMRQPGAFKGAIRVSEDELDGFSPKWQGGYGRWVRDILVWTKAPFLFRIELVPTDGMEEHRPARRDEVKRLGDEPRVVRLRAGIAMVDVAAEAERGELLAGPYRQPAGDGERRVEDATTA